MKRYNKILTAVIVSVVILSVLSLSAFAGSASTVTYDGKAQKFIFAPGSDYSLTDLFESFKNVMPGDTIHQEITVDNDISNEIKIKVYLKSTGAEQGSEALLNQMKLTVKQDGTSELFSAPADQTARLTDWVCLGTVYSGGKINLDLALEVPKDLGNEFQEKVGKLNWQFKVEEYPIEKDDPAPPTGDIGNMTVWFVAMFAALVGAAVCVILVSRKKNSEN